MFQKTANRFGGVPARRSSRLAWLAACALLATGGCARLDVALEDDATVPESVARRELGIDYLSSFRTAMAIRELNAALELEPEDPRTHLWLGEAYRRKGQTARAEAFLRQAVELAVAREETSTEHDARLNLSALLSQIGRYEDALEHCEILAQDATFASPWRPLNNCGWALMKLGRLEEARARFVSALEFFPRFGPALLNLGILESGQGHRLAAIRAFEQAIESGRLGAGGLAEANYRLGEIFVALGRRDRAIRHFRASVEEAPDADWASQAQAYLDLLR